MELQKGPLLLCCWGVRLGAPVALHYGSRSCRWQMLAGTVRVSRFSLRIAFPVNGSSRSWAQERTKARAWKMADDGAIVVCHSQRPGSTISQGAQSIRMTGGLIGSSATGPSTIAHHSYGAQLDDHIYIQSTLAPPKLIIAKLQPYQHTSQYQTCLNVLFRDGPLFGKKKT